MNSTHIKVMGIGAPIVDSIVQVNDDFLGNIHGEKGGMELVTPQEIDEILTKAGKAPHNAVAGSAGNTTYALSRMGIPCAFLGMIGNDANGELYKSQYENVDIDISRLRTCDTDPTSNCLILVTPDHERTMRTYLGASNQLTPDSLSLKDFEGITHIHVEGYMLYNEPLIRRVMELAYDSDCTVSLNLASFEVVRNCKPLIKELLENYVQIVTANDLEARAFSENETSWKDGLEALAEICPTVCVTLGDKGAVIRSFEESYTIDPVAAETIEDTTSAGDLWTAGFLYGYLQNHPLSACGKYASIVASEVVKVIGTGAAITDENWENMMSKID